VRVDDLDALDRGVVRLLRAGGTLLAEQALEREPHRLGVEGLAIVERHALAQPEAQPVVIVADPLPRLGQAGSDLHVEIAVDQAVEDARTDHPPCQEERVDRVPALRVLRLGDRQRAGGLRCGQADDERHYERDDPVFHGPSLVGLRGLAGSSDGKVDRARGTRGDRP
jgi:hypothetical protein